MTKAFALEGANFVIPFGKEPLLKDRTDGPAVIFDWTVAEAVHCAQKEGLITALVTNGRLIATLATSKSDSQIPPGRRFIYDQLRDVNCISLEFLEPGWSCRSFVRLPALPNLLTS